MNELIMMLAKYMLFLLIFAGVFAVAHLPIRFMKYDIKERYLHCRPIIVIAFLMLLSGNRFSLPYLMKGIDALISRTFLTSFFNAMTPQRNYELVYMILMILLMNLGFILIVDVVIWILRIVFRGRSYINLQGTGFINRLLHLPWNLSSIMYMESQGASEYEVNQRGCVTYHWVRRMKNAFPVIGILEIIGLSICVIGWNKNAAEFARDMSWGWYMIPSAGFLLFEQLQFFLEHVSDPSVNTFQSDNIEMELRGHLRDLVYVYEQQFAGSGALISEYIPDQISVLSSNNNYNGVTNAQQEACSRSHILGILGNQLKEAGVRTSQNYINVLVALLNDSSVSICDYLQGEILFYICVYMNYYLAEGDTFLVFCMDSDRAKVIRESIGEGMNRINKVCGVWRVGGIEEADNNENLNVLVCGFQDLVSHKLLSKRKDFFRSLKTVIIDQAVTFSAYSNIHKEMVFSELGRISKDHQYILISEVESPTLEASFGSYVSRKIYNFKNVGTRNDAYIMVWGEEGAYHIQSCLEIGGSLSEYMGVSMVLSLVAVRWQFPSIHVHAGDSKPLETYQKAMNANMKEIRFYLGKSTDYTQWIHINDFSEILDKDNLDMIVLYDDHFNLYHTLWSWMKYGGKKETLIHVVSPSYMLRDYFAYNIKELLHRDNDYAPLIGWRSGLNRSRFQALLLQMSNAGILESELMEKRREYGWSFQSVGALLEAALNSVLKGRRKAYNIYESFSFSDELVFNMAEDRYETQTTIRLIDETIRNELIMQTSFVRLSQNTSSKVEEIPILQENLTNYYLRDQVVSIKGSLRNIVNIEEGVLYTENVSSDTRRTYYQASEFSIGSRKIVDQCVDLDVLDFNIYVAYDVKRIIQGYWSSDRGINLKDTTCMQYNKIYDRHNKSKRNLIIEKNNIQMMEIRIPKRVMEGKEQEITMLLAFMLSEVTKTLFPDSYMNLYVLTEYDAAADFWEKLFDDSVGTSVEGRFHSILPFIRPGMDGSDPVSKKSLPEKDWVSIYVMEFSSVELGMITSLYTNRIKVFRMLFNYLQWYEDMYMHGKQIDFVSGESSSEAAGESGESEAVLDTDRPSAADSAKPGFLHLGFDEPPSFLAIRELREFCGRILPKHENTKIKKPGIDPKPGTICSFCGQPTVFWENINDGRRMCSECKSQMINQEEEIRELYETIVKNMHIHYGVKIPDKLHLRFASAEAIRNQTGKGNSYERVLGFCEKKDKGKKKALWIEARGPRNTVQSTLIHELTHYWQFEEFGLKKLDSLPPDHGLTVMEGHASYVEVRAMREFGEVDYADAMEKQLLARDNKDVYKNGYILMRDFILNAEQEGSHMNPFEAFRLLVESSGKGRGTNK